MFFQLTPDRGRSRLGEGAIGTGVASLADMLSCMAHGWTHARCLRPKRLGTPNLLAFGRFAPVDQRTRDTGATVTTRWTKLCLGSYGFEIDYVLTHVTHAVQFMNTSMFGE